MCSIAGLIDADGDTKFLYSFKWYLNGKSILSPEFLNVEQHFTFLNRTFFKKGDILGCQAMARDDEPGQSTHCMLIFSVLLRW